MFEWVDKKMYIINNKLAKNVIIWGLGLDVRYISTSVSLSISLWILGDFHFVVFLVFFKENIVYDRGIQPTNLD